MDLLIEKGDKRTYLSRYKVITTSFEESAPSVNRNNTQIQYRNGNVDFGGWNESKTIDYVGYYRADDLDEEESLRERIYALLSDPEGYYITQLKNDNDNSFERPGETSGDYFDKQVNRPSHKRFYVYASSLESELVGSYGGHVLYKISATFTTMKLPYGESVPRDLDVKPNVPYYGRNYIENSQPTNDSGWNFSSGGTNDHKVVDGQYIEITRTGGSWHQINRQYQNDKDGWYSEIKPGDRFAISMDISMPTIPTLDSNFYGLLRLNAGNTFSSTHTNWNLKDIIKKANTWYRVSGVTDIPDNWETDFTKATMARFMIESGTGSDTDVIRIRNIKLEKGSKATDWSPAPEDSGYNEWYLDTYYNTDNLVIPYAGTVPCNQLEQGFTIEFTAKEAGSELKVELNGTELTYSGSIVSDDVFELSGYEYTKNDISIVKDTNKAYFKLLPSVANKISSSLAGEIRILDYQDLYA